MPTPAICLCSIPFMGEGDMQLAPNSCPDSRCIRTLSEQSCMRNVLIRDQRGPYALPRHVVR